MIITPVVPQDHSVLPSTVNQIEQFSIFEQTIDEVQSKDALHKVDIQVVKTKLFKNVLSTSNFIGLIFVNTFNNNWEGRFLPARSHEWPVIHE